MTAIDALKIFNDRQVEATTIQTRNKSSESVIATTTSSTSNSSSGITTTAMLVSKSTNCFEVNRY